LIGWEGDFAAVVVEDADEGAADLGVKGVREAGDEESNAHGRGFVRGAAVEGKRGVDGSA
jgi:hypothetical protein